MGSRTSKCPPIAIRALPLPDAIVVEGLPDAVAASHRCREGPPGRHRRGGLPDAVAASHRRREGPPGRHRGGPLAAVGPPARRRGHPGTSK
jgi:hypothetical protein